MGRQKGDGYFAQELEEVSYPLGDNDCYIDESKDISKSILNDDVATNSEGEVDDMFPYWK